MEKFILGLILGFLLSLFLITNGLKILNVSENAVTLEILGTEQVYEFEENQTKEDLN